MREPLTCSQCQPMKVVRGLRNGYKPGDSRIRTCANHVVQPCIVSLGMMCAGHESAAQAQSSAGNPLPANRSRQLRARADAGDPVAQLSLGKIYDDGDVGRGVVGHKTRSQRSLGIERRKNNGTRTQCSIWVPPTTRGTELALMTSQPIHRLLLAVGSLPGCSGGSAFGGER
jgi:hypothetical protein